jgi:limonene-1,2-epoxide hydrolase
VTDPTTTSPAAIDVDRAVAVTITWEDGHVSRYALPELRHGPRSRLIDTYDAPAAVRTFRETLRSIGAASGGRRKGTDVNPEDVVRGEMAAWGRLDVGEILSYFAPHAVWDNVPLGPATGHDEIRKLLEGWIGRTTSFEAEMLNLAVAGQVVLTERVDHIVLDGKPIHARVMGAFEIEGDKIKAWRDYFDMGGQG